MTNSVTSRRITAHQLRIDRPGQAFGQRAAHDPLKILFREEVHFLGKHRYGLPIGALGTAQQGRQVGAPETPVRSKGVDQLP